MFNAMTKHIINIMKEYGNIIRFKL